MAQMGFGESRWGGGIAWYFPRRSHGKLNSQRMSRPPGTTEGGQPHIISCTALSFVDPTITPQHHCVSCCTASQVHSYHHL